MSTAQDSSRTTTSATPTSLPEDNGSVGNRGNALPRYRSRPCCRRAEQSVLVTGTLDGVQHEELEQWLRSMTALPFEHIIKKQGHAYVGPAGGMVRFSEATYFKSDRKIAYIANEHRKRQRGDADNQPANRESPPYALYENRGSYTVCVCAPGVSDKDQARLDVGEDGQTLTISAEFEINCVGSKIVDHLPSTLNLEVPLPGKISKERPVK
ncbi:7966_t:CDS:2, partial [Paraglomus brasilianum]